MHCTPVSLTPSCKLQVELSLAVGLAEAWQAFCRDNPSEGAELTASMTGVNLDASKSVTGALTTKSAANDLIVSVVSAQGLRARVTSSGDGTIALRALPSPYVQYTLPLPSAKTGSSKHYHRHHVPG